MTAGTQHVQGDLPPETVVFWKAIAAAFPQLDSLGSWGDRSHAARKSDHNAVTSSGKKGPHAVDCMTADAALHERIVKWALLNREQYGITLIISRRRKWSAASNWQQRPYLGTSGHYDHVHLSNDGTPHAAAPVVPVKPVVKPLITVWRDPGTGAIYVPIRPRTGRHIGPAEWADLQATHTVKIVAGVPEYIG